MKDVIIKVLVSLVVVFSTVASFYVGKWKEQKDKAIRWQENYDQVKNDISKVVFTVEELRSQLDPKLDSIIKVSNIKPKNITQITNVINNYTDTVWVEANVSKKSETVYLWNDTLGCIKVEGFVDIENETPEVTVTKKVSRTNSTFIGYSERESKPFPSEKFKLWQWKLPWFKKKDVIKETTDCGDVKYHNIEVIKK